MTVSKQAANPAGSSARPEIKGQVSQNVGNLLVERAQAHFMAGDFNRVLACCEQIQQRIPDHPDALNLQGMVAKRKGDNPAALTLLVQALTAHPEHKALNSNIRSLLTSAHCSASQLEVICADLPAGQLPFETCEALLALGIEYQHYEALAYLLAGLVQRDASQAGELVTLADRLFTAGLITEALALYRSALSLEAAPSPGLYIKLGMALFAGKDFPGAEASFMQALTIEPNYFPALLTLAEFLVDRKRYQEASGWLDKINRTSVTDIRVIRCRIKILRKTGRYVEAKQVMVKALSSAPDDLWMLGALAETYLKLLNYQYCQYTLDRMFRLDPDNTDALCILVSLQDRQHQLGNAADLLDKVLKQKPDDFVLKHNLSYFYLKIGRFQEGWDLYESRLLLDSASDITRHSSPVWQGEPLAGKTILITFEQGFGDFLLCLAYCKTLRELGGKVIVECPSAMHLLVSYSQIADGINLDPGKSITADFHIPYFSIPRVLQEGIAFHYPQTPFLQADTTLINNWKQQFSTLTGYKTGICWQGRTTFAADEIRSFELINFLPIAGIHNVDLISLQVEPRGKAQIPEFRLFSTLHDVDDMTDKVRDFMDTAAIMKNLDLFITSDSSVAHLAGALGIKVWVILGDVADWRWFLDRDDCYWYPSMRVFRKNPGENWQPVFQRVTAALELELAGT